MKGKGEKIMTDTEERELSTRGLIDADFGPLRRFTGILDSTPTDKQTFGEGDKARESTRVSLNFKEIDVKESVEPYHFPIYVVTLSQSTRKKSRWGVFSEGTPKDRSVGFNNVVDQQYSPEQLDPTSPEYIKPSERMDLKDCLGKRFGMVLTDGQEGRPEPMNLFDGRSNTDKPTPAWTVYEVEGIGTAGGQGTSPMEVAMDLLDGKTLAQFNKDALANPVIRGDTTLLQSISMPVSAPSNFANTLVKSGAFAKDKQGVYHKVISE